MQTLKLISALLILSTTIVSGIYPFVKKLKTKRSYELPMAESLAAGIFLGAGLMHMLGDASQRFYALKFNYPIAFLLAGTTFLLLLLLEHIARALHEHRSSASNAFAILSVVMLSLHSFLAGAALGLSGSLSMTIIILFAILCHKWAASFALSIQINKSNLSLKYAIVLFLLFSFMAPLGIACGSTATQSLSQYPLLEPIFTSLAAGTFLYLGSLHGLEQAVLIKQCCNLKAFSFVIMGFMIMAVAAIWT